LASKTPASELEIKIAPSRELAHDVRALTAATDRRVWGVVFAASLIAGVLSLSSRPAALGISLSLLGSGVVDDGDDLGNAFFVCRGQGMNLT